MKKYILYSNFHRGFLAIDPDVYEFYTTDIFSATEMSLEDAKLNKTNDIIIVPAPFCNLFFD